jgi:Fe-S cluster assembly iron-binding protein IscA
MVTPEATDVIKRLAAAPQAEGVRISTAPQSLDGRGAGLEVELASGPDAFDHVVEAEGARIFLGPGVVDALDGKVLDAEVEDGEVRFAVLEQEQ